MNIVIVQIIFGVLILYGIDIGNLCEKVIMIFIKPVHFWSNIYQY